MDLDVDVKRFLPTLTDDTEGIFKHLLEVYIDDFIGLIQAADESTVWRFSRCILHAIYDAFPPPAVTGSDMGPAVSRKKLEKEGKWETRKEILGWLIDRIHRTIKLPPNKCKTLCSEITSAIDYARNSPKNTFPWNNSRKFMAGCSLLQWKWQLANHCWDPWTKG